MINTIILGHVLDVLPQLPAESVSCVITSPPYWGLRDYGVEPIIWDGDKDCKHDFDKINRLHPTRGNRGQGVDKKYPIRELQQPTEIDSNFCLKCNAWRGSLGLEPTFELYIKHLCDIFDEVKRVLRKDGTVFVNLGDSYAGSGKAGSNPEYQNRHTEFGKPSTHSERFGMPTINIGVPDKSLCLIPQRFVIEMVNRDWILRNTIIWHKPNCMPSSAKDRFTVDFEDVFFFTKNNKAIFWTNEKTLECMSKQPLGIKGVEGKDWEWRSCPACSNKNYFNYRTRDVMKKEKDCPQFKASDKEKQNIKNKICPRCKGLRKVKYSFWSGHDYWFDQQFEEYAPDTLPRMDRGVNINKWTLGADGQTPHNLSQPRLNKKRGYKIKQQDKGTQHPQYHGKDINYGKQGRNKRTVWVIPTKSFPEAHFAVYPETLIEPMIKAGCPEFVCKKCGKARVKIIDDSERVNTRPGLDTGNMKSGKDVDPNKELHKSDLSKYRQQIKYKELGYTDCGCNAGWEIGIILDPFIGAGTTVLVALKQRRRFVGIEIKKEYRDMSYMRIARVQQRIF